MRDFSSRLYVASVSELEEEFLYQKAYHLLPKERQETINAYRFFRDRRLSMGGFLLLMWGLKEWGIPAQEMEIAVHHGGKPYLKSQNNCYFNISHSGEYAICAISEQEIGCDVEQISNYRKGIVERFFSPSERQLFSGINTEEEKKMLFFRLWTLKESYIKTVGLGLSVPLDSFSISFSAGRDSGEIISVTCDSVHKNREETEYYFREFDIHPLYRCALCGLDKNIESENMIICEKAVLSEIIGFLSEEISGGLYEK